MKKTYVRCRSLQLSSVEKIQKFLKDGSFNVFDDDLLCSRFDHVRFEHGSEDGTSGGDDTSVSRKDCVSDVELEVGEELLFCRQPKFVAHQGVDWLVTVLVDRLHDVNVEIV